MLMVKQNVLPLQKQYPDWENNTVACLGKVAEEWFTGKPPEDAAALDDSDKAPVEFTYYDDDVPILPAQEHGEAIKSIGRRRVILRLYLNELYCTCIRLPCLTHGLRHRQ